MSVLKPHQLDLLARIVASGGLPSREVDGRLLRPLRAAGLVAEDGGRVVPTAAGRRTAGNATGPADCPVRLNARQEDLLRRIVRRREVPEDEVDGRIARPLIAGGLVTRAGGALSSTRAGREYLESGQPARRGRRRPGAEHARAATIRSAVQRLESAIPRDSEVLVGNIMASADDVLDAIRQHAIRMERGS